ncbi:GntR family transcriptional regulator [Tomitella biformata]|uniref:GntR family transcriptional regulator n=1 Tax=Tomitella biformata TaxID=630403 RepID=UPI000464D2E4|nr:GntR family transcriptional regulator [Tomitella biformata]
MAATARGAAGTSGPGALARRPQLSEDVANHVRRRIMTGQVRPGEFIRLDETAAELGVSVTPVREALLTLRGEGMVESVPHRGYIVAALSRADVTDIFWLQEQIAVQLSLRAAAAIAPETIARLQFLNHSLRAAVRAGDEPEIVRFEFEFHRLINISADASKLAWFLNSALRYTPQELYSGDPGWQELAVTSHERLIEALKTGDLDAVEAETRIQFTDGAQRLIAHLEQIGMWAEA